MQLIGRCLDPSKKDPLTAPIVLLWGARGGAVGRELRRVLEECPPERPSFHGISGASDAPVDRDAVVIPAGLRPYEVALVLASHMGSRVRGFGRLRFPRLLLGALVVRDPPTAPDSDEVRQRVLRERLRSRRAVLGWVANAAQDITKISGLPDPANRLVGLMAGGAVAFLGTVPPLRGRALSWYGRPGHDPVDGLVVLAGHAAADRHDARDHVDTTLCRAFLADLREEYGRASWYAARSGRVLVVLDGIDDQPLADFVGVLARLHDEDAPIVVVGGARKRGPEHSDDDSHPERWPVRDARRSSWEDWVEGAPTHEGWTARYPLDVTRPYPDDAAAVHAEIVDRLARGHPLGDELLRPVARSLREPHAQRGLLDASAADVPVSRDWGGLRDGTPSSAFGRRTVADEVVDAVLGDWPSTVLEPLLRLAAAPDLRRDRVNRALFQQPPQSSADARDFLARDLWVIGPEARTPEGGAPAAPVLHPLARRSLLHRLARPPAGTNQSWSGVHQALLGHARLAGASGDWLYHALALGQVHEVARELSRPFEQPDGQVRWHVEEWYGELMLATAAPVDDPRAGTGARALVRARAGHTAPEPTVRRTLVAALQVHGDPLGDPGHELCRDIHGALAALAGECLDGGDFLFDRAEEFLDCWRRRRPRGGGAR